MGLILMLVGFMWWWPLGLIILAVLIANGRIGYRRRLQFAGSGPTGDWDHVTRMDRTGKKADRVPAKTDGLRDRVRGNWLGQPSSGNRAFDDYRAETLRRLEDEQREFKGILQTSTRCQGSRRIRPVHERSASRRAVRLQTRDLVELFPLRRHVADNGERNQAANDDLECVASCRGSDANHHKV